MISWFYLSLFFITFSKFFNYIFDNLIKSHLQLSKGGTKCCLNEICKVQKSTKAIQGCNQENATSISISFYQFTLPFQ